MEQEKFGSNIIKDADEFLIFVFDSEESVDPSKMSFDDIETANRFKSNLGEITSEQRLIVEKLTSKESFLDSLIDPDKQVMVKDKEDKNSKNFLVAGDETMAGMPLEEFEKKFKKIKKRFKEKRLEFENKAKNALLEAAKLYLGDKNEEEYVKYKLELNSRGLGAIMYQIFTMEDALHSLSARIKVSGAHLNARDIEVFTGLQRVILDAQKFQFEYLQTIESSMKELKNDYDMIGSGVAAGGDTESELLFIRGGKDLIKQLASIKNEMNTFIASPSKNINLNPDATEVEDVMYKDAENGDQVSATPELKNPMAGYEGAIKKPKKERDEFDENKDDDYDL